MTISNILAPLSGSPDDAVVLATAFAAAKPFGAHVSAVLVSPDAHEIAYAPDMHESVTVREKHAAQSRHDALVAFNEAARCAGAVVSDIARKSGTLTASFKEETGRLVSILASKSLFADIIVFPPLRPPVQPALHDAFVRTLMTAGKPVLLSPHAAPRSLGGKIAVGWDGGLPARHALLASMPFLERSGDVEFLAVGKGTVLDETEVAEFLSLHGVNMRICTIQKPAGPVGEALLDAAKGSDLLVVGGYGHSRVIETIFGGATQYVTSHADVPILLTH
jgi:nucleotide-binding universal stress UspA family protein